MDKAQILIVENEGVVAKDIEATLLRLGYAVPAIAATGKRAVEMATELRPDLLLMDIKLEDEMDGIEAAGQIRRTLGIPVIYVTAYADDQTLRRANASEPFGFIIKPFNERELQATVEMALARYKLERQIKESHEWFSTMLRCIGEAVLATDINGNVTFMNALAEDMTGWKHEQAMGKNLGDLVIAVNEATGEPIENPALRVLREKSPGTRAIAQIALVLKRGAKLPIESSASLIRSPDGTPIGSVVVFRDVTQRRGMERAVLSRQKMQAIGRLAGSIAHEFSNLIGIIASHATSIADNLLPGTRAYEDADKILETARHAGDFTKRILNVARASGTDPGLKIEPVSLAEVVSTAIALVEKPFNARNVTFKVKKLTAMPHVIANASQFLDVLMDLFLNAAEAMPDGGTIFVDAAEITMKRAPDNSSGAPSGRARRYAVLRVRDTGVGMTKDVLDRLFEPFYTTRAETGGIGLGLSLAQSAIERCGGWVKVTSRPGHGATFSLFVPKANVRRTRVAKSIDQIPKGATVLVVDDKKDFLDQVRATLQAAGFRIYSATGGDEAVKLYREHADEIDLSIIDVIMPGKNGKQVLDDILEIDSTALAIMMCGFSRDYTRSLMQPGAWHFIQKPFAGEQLLNVIRRSLSQKAV